MLSSGNDSYLRFRTPRGELVGFIAQDEVWLAPVEPGGRVPGVPGVAPVRRGWPHLGHLGLHTDTVAHPTDAARDLIGTLAPLIGYAVDPLRTITAAARLVHGASAGVVLTRAGHPVPLPGLPTHPLLGEGSALVTLAARLTDGRAHTVFLCPQPGPGPAAGHVQATVLTCPTQPPNYLTAVVVLAPAGDLCGLTGRELQVLGLLIKGWTNARIAAALVIASRTVAAM